MHLATLFLMSFVDETYPGTDKKLYSTRNYIAMLIVISAVDLTRYSSIHGHGKDRRVGGYCMDSTWNF